MVRKNVMTPCLKVLSKLGQDEEGNSQIASLLILPQRQSCETPRAVYYVPVLIDLHGILMIERRTAASPLALTQPAQ
jgi:hypothetical protein